ncbi:glycoside hydrolase [Imleria badia]|nr:glycoside hydrolase [Imleria badia]
MQPQVPNNHTPFGVGHSAILSHAYAIKVYRDKFKSIQKGEIGITLNGDWAIPYDDSPENVEAAKHALGVAIGWFADPIYLDHYPGYLKQMLGDRRPDFTAEELAVVQGSSDFYGMNTYTTHLCREPSAQIPKALAVKMSFKNSLSEYTFTRPNGTQLGTQAQCAWLQDYPQGFRVLLNYPWKRYGLPIYVTENGFAVKDENSKPLEEALQEYDRVNYFKGTTAALKAPVLEDGVDVWAYLPWSFLDNFECEPLRADAYLTKFGVTYVDYENQRRHPKESAKLLIKWSAENVGSGPTPEAIQWNAASPLTRGYRRP